MSVIQIDCPKCGGDGFLPQFSHINGGTCYKCSGTGKIDMTVRDDMDETVLKMFPNLYVEHKYNELSSLDGDEQFYFEAVRERHNQTVAKFISGNEELKESIAYIEKWAEENNYPVPESLYKVSYTNREVEGAWGAVSTEFVPVTVNGERKYLRGEAKFFIQPDVGFPQADNTPNKKDLIGYDMDNTYIHEMIHVIDLINQNAKLLGKPDSEKRKRVAQAKANVFDDYMKALTGDGVKMYEQNILDTPLTVRYLEYAKIERIQKFARKTGKLFIERGASETLAQQADNMLPNFSNYDMADYREFVIRAFQRGDYDKGMEFIDKLKRFSGNNLKEILYRHANKSEVEGIPDSEHDVTLDHLNHLPLQLAFKSALQDEHYMTHQALIQGIGSTTKGQLDEIIVHARDAFRESRSSWSTNGTLEEITHYASEDLTYEEMDYLRRSYRVVRGMDKPEEGETYLSTLSKLRETLAGDKEKYGMNNLMINNILTRMSFDYYLPSKRPDAYSLYNANEFNAELGSSMLGSKSRDEDYTEPMKELKKAFEDFYHWNSLDAFEEQDRKQPIINDIRGFLVEKREQEEQWAQEYYRSWEAIKEDYLIPGESAMSRERYNDYMEDFSYLEERALQQTGKTFRQLVGDESYTSIQNIVTVSFPRDVLGGELRRLNDLSRDEMTDLSLKLEEALEWWDINESEMRIFVDTHLSQINEMYRYHNIPNRDSIRQLLMQMGIDIENYQEDEEDDF